MLFDGYRFVIQIKFCTSISISLHVSTWNCLWKKNQTLQRRKIIQKHQNQCRNWNLLLEKINFWQKLFFKNMLQIFKLIGTILVYNCFDITHIKCYWILSPPQITTKDEMCSKLRRLTEEARQAGSQKIL